jgi:hypothetical protein
VSLTAVTCAFGAGVITRVQVLPGDRDRRGIAFETVRYVPYILATVAGLALGIPGILSLGIGAVYGGAALAILGVVLPYAGHLKREQARTH